ncbi:centrosomal protein of 162 kDa isoform X2 [Hemicordylus capensis]|uniref:centrosomal protein of 162 kDa isoform X2 n=1 Tax=Hemicordylus capensis TaxID=884348 RepID=UPI0023044C23|nr:centrosomal protein of 162 kDa isoform X2 [Hemicordylus capensis]
MAHRFSKDDLDEQFEQFLKESLSDDSFGNEPKKKSSILETTGQTKKKELKKQSVPWWISEDDSDDDPKTKFIKQGDEKRIIGGKDEMVEDGEKKIPLSNNQSGVHGSGGSFLKSQRLSHSIQEVDEDHVEVAQLQQTGGVSVSLSRDSLETNDSVVASGPLENLEGVGLDTLEEQEEKERFFANLEKGASSTIDYSRLNKELDSNNSEVLQAFLRNHPDVKQVEEANEEEPKNCEKSADYSEDFEEESELNEDFKAEQAFVSEANEEKTGMLAKVVLIDSQDSTMETQNVIEQKDSAVIEHHPPQEVIADKMNETGISCGQTNSDIEALHQAYCHIEQSLGDTNETRINADKIETAENSVKDASQNKEDFPQNTSATDSDLPTIEELMKPLRAESSFARGHYLEPASSVEVAHNCMDDLASHFPLREPQNDIALEKQNVGYLLSQQSEQESISVQTAVKGDGDDSCLHRTGKDNQVDKIKRDPLKQNVLQNSSIFRQDNKTNQVYQPSTWNKEGLNSLMNKQVTYKNAKSTVALHTRKKSLSGPHSSVRSSGYGKSSSPLKHFSTVSEKKAPKEGIKKPALKVKSPPRQREIFSGTKIIQTAADPVSTKRNCLATSGHLPGSNLQQQAKEKDSCLQVHNSSGRELYLLRRVQEAEEKLAAANDLIQRLEATRLQKEKEMETHFLEMKMQQDKNLFQLNQENYVLQTQLNNREELNKGTKWTNIWERIPDDGEMLKEIQKEVQNQETLLQGYQQENERLYKQVKELQMNNKKNEENMFKENQRLMTELASLKEQMDKNNLLSCGVQNTEPAGNQSFTDLISELRAAKTVEFNLLEERKRLKQDKQALEVDLGQVKKERDLARAQIAATSDEKLYEMKIMEESYKEEIGRLQKRLQWYAENQELLDKDAARLRGAKEEIDKLKLEVDKLRSEAGNQSVQQKKRLKDRAADAKRIQDLERQVKEMEGILKRRYPNSLPALIYAAATAASQGDGDASTKSNTLDFLEKRVKKLEAELEGKDDEAKKSLRAMEQQFQKIKLQYEKRVGELEQLLAYKLLNEPQKLQDKAANLVALEQELSSANEAHQVTVKNLQTEIDSLRNQVAQLEHQKTAADDADFQSLEYQVEQAHTKAKLVRLNQEMVAKNREIQDLTRTVERLQKERRVMLSDKDSAGKMESKTKPSKTSEKNIFRSSQRNTGNEEFFPGTLDNKIYQPNAFADSHSSEILQENARLKDELEKLTLGLSQQRVTSQAALANSESLIRRTKEDSEEYIAALKASHQKELEKILCQHAMEHSSSKVAELNSKISTQEILIKHLQQQVHEFQRDQEALAFSQIREEILQKEMAKLLEELGEAKKSQNPEMKHFVCLERKIKQLEARYEQREQELQQVIQQTQHLSEVEQFQETEKWRKLALLKNQEMEKFRIELDSMLDVLRQLQKQGVVIPASGSSMPESYWKI